MSSYYAGLDVSDATTAICVINEKGEIQFEGETETYPAAIAGALKPFTRLLKKVGHEASTKAPWLHKELTRKRFPMVCLDARAAGKALSAQRNKTDKNDARGIANILRTSWYTAVHIKSDQALKYRLILAHRRLLIRKDRSMEHGLRMSLKQFGAELRTKGQTMVVKRGTRRQDPELSRLAGIVLRARAAVKKEIAALDKLVADIVRKDDVCRRLMTVPGVGPITALTFMAAVDDPARFSSSRDVAASFGLTPRRFQSGTTDASGHISHMGDASVRSALYASAFTLLTHAKTKCALRTWGLALRRKKGIGHAATATARKLAVVMHRMWITERDFEVRLA